VLKNKGKERKGR